VSAIRVILYFFAIALGALFIISGEADDSPGLQGIGLILILLTLARIFRHPLRKYVAKLADKGDAP
jgi:hypothetical protein